MDSSDLAVERARYLIDSGRAGEAKKAIEAYCTKPRKAGTNRAATASAEAWILWASLVAPNLRKQKNILDRAERTIPIESHPDHMTVLLQLFGAQMKVAEKERSNGGGDKENDNDDDDESEDDEKDDNVLYGTLQKILLLAPKTLEDVRVEGTGLEFELADVNGACLACLDHFRTRKGIRGARSVYNAVLFRSTVALSEENQEDVKAFVDRCLEIERDEPGMGWEEKKRILLKLYNRAMQVFRETPLEGFYREERNENVVFGDAFA